MINLQHLQDTEAPACCNQAGVSSCRGGDPMAMRPMTHQLVTLDAQLRDLSAQIHDHTWDAEEVARIRGEIDALLERRLALSG